MRLFSTPSDDSIIRQVLSGQRQQFGLLVQRHLPSVYAVAYAQTRNHADAEDIAQEAFLKAFAALDSLRDPRRFEGWIVTIARNLAYSLWQHRKHEVSVANPSAEAAGSLPDEVARREMQALLRQRIEGLDPMQREILLLHYFAGKSTHEIASILDISSAAVKKRLQRAREALSRDLLTTMEGAFEPPRPLPEQSKAILGAITAVGAVAWEASGSAALVPAGFLAKLAGLALKSAVLAVTAATTIGISIALWNTGGDLEAKQRPESPQKETVSVAQPPPEFPSALSPGAASPSSTIAESRDNAPEAISAPDQTETKTTRKEEKTKTTFLDPEKALKQPVSIEFENIHIAEVLDFAADSYDINLVLDQRAVAQPVSPASARPAPPSVSPAQIQYATDGMVQEYKVEEQPLRDALTMLCEPLGLEYTAGPRFVWISTPEMLAADGPWKPSKSTQEYDLDTLLDTPVALEFRDVHINEILAFIADSWDINLVWDWRVIQPPVKTGPNAACPANMEYSGAVVSSGVVPYIQLKNIALGDTLEALLRPLNLSYSIEEGFIWITSAARLQRERFAPLSRTGITPELAEILQAAPSVEFSKQHLAQALAFLESESGLPVYVDTRVMTPGGPRLYQLTCHGLPIYSLLNILTRECDMGYVAQEDRVMISTPDRLLTRKFPPESYVAAGEFAKTVSKDTAITAPAQKPADQSLPGAGPALCDIQTSRGVCRAKIQTPNAERWYSTGESFEQYRVVNIDAAARTCTLHDEGRNIDLTLPPTEAAGAGENPGL